MLHLTPPERPTTATGFDPGQDGGAVRIDAGGQPVAVSSWDKDGGLVWDEIDARLREDGDAEAIAVSSVYAQSFLSSPVGGAYAVERIIPQASSRKSLITLAESAGFLVGLCRLYGSEPKRPEAWMWRRDVLGIRTGTSAAECSAAAVAAAGGRPDGRRLAVRWPGTLPACILTEHTAEAYGIALWAAGWRLRVE